MYLVVRPIININFCDGSYQDPTDFFFQIKDVINGCMNLNFFQIEVNFY
jgi:hypothetical protein